MLGARVVAGRSFVPEEHRAGNAPNVILGHRLWESRFGRDLSVVGRTVALAWTSVRDFGHCVVSFLPDCCDSPAMAQHVTRRVERL
jgi:hypothetical protein